MNGAKEASIYILPGDTVDVTAALAAGKTIGTVNFDNGATSSSYPAEPARSTYGNAVAMEAGKEYLLVFDCNKLGRAHGMMVVDSVTLTREGLATPADIIPERAPEPDPIPTGSTIYDIDLSDPVRGN